MADEQVIVARGAVSQCWQRRHRTRDGLGEERRVDEGGNEEGALEVTLEARGCVAITVILDEGVRLEYAVQEEENVVRGSVDTQTVEKDMNNRREIGDPAAVLCASEERDGTTVLKEKEGGEEVRHGQGAEVLVED